MALPEQRQDRRSRPARRASEREDNRPAGGQGRVDRPAVGYRLAGNRRRQRSCRPNGFRRWPTQPKYWPAIQRRPGVGYPVLVPNIKGLERAHSIRRRGGRDVRRRVGEPSARRTSTAPSPRAWSVSAPWRRRRWPRASACAAMSVACWVAPTRAKSRSRKSPACRRRLLDLGCYEISLGDTIGVGTAGKARALIERVAIACRWKSSPSISTTPTDRRSPTSTPVWKPEWPWSTASVAGLGGCPYAKGASGNVATEDVVYLLNGLGIETGVDLKSLAATGAWISQALSRPNGSRTGNALAAA